MALIVSECPRRYGHRPCPCDSVSATAIAHGSRDRDKQPGAVLRASRALPSSSADCFGISRSAPIELRRSLFRRRKLVSLNSASVASPYSARRRRCRFFGEGRFSTLDDELRLGVARAGLADVQGRVRRTSLLLRRFAGVPLKVLKGGHARGISRSRAACELILSRIARFQRHPGPRR